MDYSVVLESIEVLFRKFFDQLRQFRLVIDLFFLDPPFAENNFLNVLKTIKKCEIYKSKHLIVLHRERKTNDNFDNLINVINYKIYGRSKIIFGFFAK